MQATELSISTHVSHNNHLSTRFILRQLRWVRRIMYISAVLWYIIVIAHFQQHSLRTRNAKKGWAQRSTEGYLPSRSMVQCGNGRNVRVWLVRFVLLRRFPTKERPHKLGLLLVVFACCVVVLKCVQEMVGWRAFIWLTALCEKGGRRGPKNAIFVIVLFIRQIIIFLIVLWPI